MPQETATNSLDARELLPLDSVEMPSSNDQTPDASSLEPPRENVTEVESAFKLKSFEGSDKEKKRFCPMLFSSSLFSSLLFFQLHFIKK